MINAAELANVLASPAGRQIIWDILEECQVFSSPFDKQSAEATAFRCGMQAIGQEIISAINAEDPTAFARLLLTKTEINNATRNDSTTDSE